MGDPLWLRAFTAVEGAVGPRIEDFVHGKKFSTAVVVVQKVKSGVGGFAERRTRGVWHLVNLPAGTDVRQLRNQIGDLDHEVRSLRGMVDSVDRKRARAARATEQAPTGTGKVGEKGSGSGGRSSASSTERGSGASASGRGAQRAARPQRDQGDQGVE